MGDPNDTSLTAETITTTTHYRLEHHSHGQTDTYRIVGIHTAGQPDPPVADISIRWDDEDEWYATIHVETDNPPEPYMSLNGFERWAGWLGVIGDELEQVAIAAENDKTTRSAGAGA